MSQLSTLLLSLFILNLGTAFGAGLYEAIIVLPKWFHKRGASDYQADTKAMQELDSGRKFWAFVTTIPLTLLTLVNLILAWKWQPPGLNWWLGAALLALIERLGTFLFFIPTIIKLQQANLASTPGTSRVILFWLRLNYIRNGLTLIACLLALKALTQVG